MKQKLAVYGPLLWLLAIPILNVFYGVVNHGGANTGNLMTDLDNRIPFVPGFIIPYLLWYPFIFGMFVAFYFTDRKVYYRSLAILCLGLLACYLIYAVFQTTIPRPSIEHQGLIYRIVGIVYKSDAPFNCFPSIHVLTSHVVIKAAYQCKLKRPVQAAVFAMAWIIIISTLFVKQHALLDIAGAILLSEMLYFSIGLIDAYRARKEKSVYEL